MAKALEEAYLKSSQHRSDVLAKERKQAGVLVDAVFAQTKIGVSPSPQEVPAGKKGRKKVPERGPARPSAFDLSRDKEATAVERAQAKFAWKNAVGRVRGLHQAYGDEEGRAQVLAPGDAAVRPASKEEELHQELVRALENGEGEVALDLMRSGGIRVDRRFRASCSYRGALQNAGFPNRTFEECSYLHLAVLGNASAGCVEALLAARCDPAEQVGTAMVGFCPGSAGDSKTLIPKAPRRTSYTAYELALDLDINAGVIDLLKQAIRQRCRAYHATGTSCQGSTLERSWKPSWEWRPEERKPGAIVIPDLLDGTVCRRPSGVGYNWLEVPEDLPPLGSKVFSDEEDEPGEQEEDQSPNAASSPSSSPKGKGAGRRSPRSPRRPGGGGAAQGSPRPKVRPSVKPKGAPGGGKTTA